MNNEPAFPYTESNVANSGGVGLSLRDYFAAKVIPWVCSDLPQPCESFYKRAAVLSYKLADAMLEAREST